MLNARNGQIVNELRRLFEGGGKCQLQRWIPMEHAGSTAAAAMLLKGGSFEDDLVAMESPAGSSRSGEPKPVNGVGAFQEGGVSRRPMGSLSGADIRKAEEVEEEENVESVRSYKASRPRSLDGFISGACSKAEPGSNARCSLP